MKSAVQEAFRVLHRNNGTEIPCPFSSQRSLRDGRTVIARIVDKTLLVGQLSTWGSSFALIAATFTQIPGVVLTDFLF